MELAIKQAKIARKNGDYAIGAVLVSGNKVISKSCNKSKIDENPIAHAEALAILKACKKYHKRRLQNCVLYSTHEPCPMCASLIVWARLKGVVYGARYQDMKKYRKNYANKHYLWRTIDIPCKEVFNKSTEKIDVVKDYLRDDCIKLFYNDEIIKVKKTNELKRHL